MRKTLYQKEAKTFYKKLNCITRNSMKLNPKIKNISLWKILNIYLKDLIIQFNNAED